MGERRTYPLWVVTTALVSACLNTSVFVLSRGNGPNLPWVPFLGALGAWAVLAFATVEPHPDAKIQRQVERTRTLFTLAVALGCLALHCAASLVATRK